MPLPSYPTIRRYLKAQGMVRHSAAPGARGRIRPRSPGAEVRSFEVEHVGALWHLDFHHGTRAVLTRGGLDHTVAGLLDDRSRLVCHLQWGLDEGAESLVHGLCQASCNAVCHARS